MRTAIKTKNRSIKYLAVALILSCILPAYKAGILSSKAMEVANDDVCLSEECIHTASSVLKKMKRQANPCDDFYEFACGSFLDETILPGYRGYESAFSFIHDKMEVQLNQLIKAERPASDPKHERLPNILYKACMNEQQIESLGTTPIVNIVEPLGGWPLLLEDRWNLDTTWSWEKQTEKLSRLGLRIMSITSFGLELDYKNNSRRMIVFRGPSFKLEQEFLVKGFNETLVTAYYDYMVDIAVLLGANKARAQEELLKSLEFEIALARIYLPAEERRDLSKEYNLHTLRQLQQSYPQVQWLTLINSIFSEGAAISEEELINLTVPSFFDKLGPLLAKTPKRVIANYMMWHIHLYAVKYLPKDFRNRRLQYQKEKLGVELQMPRWKECVETVNEIVPIAVSSLYVKKYFKRESKDIVLDMVNDIKSVFEDILHNVTWMDSLTKAEAKQKLRQMYIRVGYPDEMLDTQLLATNYAKLDFNENAYFASILEYNKFDSDFSYNMYQQPFNKKDWKDLSRVAVVNAFDIKRKNSLQIPAAILQGSCFNAQRPSYMNYGAIGTVIGHELTHGFDDEGSQFDFDGNVRDWWQPESAKEYRKKAQCIIEQYGNYTDTLTGLRLNGINTQGENIADNGGAKQAYIAYNRWVAQHGKEPTLPGLNYTAQQMFWIAFAQDSCEKYSKEYLKELITTFQHAPKQFRLVGTLQNMKDFATDFQCPEGSPMNPIHKCEVW